MSGALVQAAPLKPEIRLARAISEFEAGLSDEQKASFRGLKSRSIFSPPGLSDVMRLTAEIDKRSSEGGLRRCYGPRLTNFLQAVQQFSSLGDIVIGGSQNLIACGVWSLSLVHYSTYIDKFSILLMGIGRSAPRYQQMALLYPRSQSLQSSLCEYFIVVVHLCHQGFKLTQKSGLKKFTSSFSNWDTNAYQVELERWTNAIDEEVKLLMARKLEDEGQENSRFRALSSKRSKSKALHRAMKTKLRILDACSTYDHETSWKQIRKAGNTTLFNGNAKYEGWKCQTESCTLVYTGKLGSGKSVLLANIVDDLYLCTEDQNATVTYFFCRHDVPESLKARTIIGSLARQLLRGLSDVNSMEQAFDIAATALDIDQIFQLLQQTFPTNRKVYFVLDGLDECNTAERDTLLGQIRHIQAKFVLLFCISSRLEPDDASKFRPDEVTAATFTAIPALNPDIEGFIRAELETCIEYQKLVVQDPMIVLEIQDALMAGSQGMFLWVALQIVFLCSMESDYAIRQALVDLPKDLSEAFSRALRRPDKSKRTYEYQRLILELMIVALRPLTTEELREALSVVPGDTDWNSQRLLNDIYSTLSCCGGLVIVDEEELTVRLVHNSVKQFILEEYRDSTNKAIKIDDAEETVAKIVLTYLNYDVLETQLSAAAVPQMHTKSVPNMIIESTMSSSSHIRIRALSLLRSRKQLNYDIGKTIAETRRLFKTPLKNEFHFHTYAKTFLFEHGVYIPEKEPLMLDLLIRAIQKNSVNANVKNQAGVTPLSLAASMGHETMVKALLETGKVDANAKSIIRPLEMTPLSIALSIAVENGHEAVVKALLEARKINAVMHREYDDSALLELAARNGHEAVFMLLVETRRAQILLRSHEERVQIFIRAYAKEPLPLAAKYGLEEAVKFLLETEKEYMDLGYGAGRMVLLAAEANGHQGVVKILQDYTYFGTRNFHIDATELTRARSLPSKTRDRPEWLRRAASQGDIHVDEPKLVRTRSLPSRTRDKSGRLRHVASQGEPPEAWL